MRYLSRSIGRSVGNFLLLSSLLLLIVSCTTTDRRDQGDALIEGLSDVRFKSWQQDASAELGAINVLLNDADSLIAKNAFNAATDKLERVLRIKPEYAPAWSRLSWLALQSDSPKRAVQMAKRSNSFAYSDVQLQLLNWSFVLTASETLNDEDVYLRASQKIRSLQAH